MTEKIEKKPQTTSKDEKYIDLGESKEINIKPTCVGEVPVNPNSYENVKVILDSLKQNLQIGSEREWTILGCDGPPYCLASRLIESDSDYDWLTMTPGLGHLNMNQMKGFFKV